MSDQYVTPIIQDKKGGRRIVPTGEMIFSRIVQHCKNVVQ